MKNIKKMIFLGLLGTGFLQQSIYADKKTQDQIREIVNKHQTQAKALKQQVESKKLSPKEEEKKLKEILEHFKKEMQQALKNAPNTAQYIELKKAIEHFNPKEITQNYTHIKTILKNVDKDIKDAILSLIPTQYLAFFWI